MPPLAGLMLTDAPSVIVNTVSFMFVEVTCPPELTAERTVPELFCHSVRLADWLAAPFTIKPFVDEFVASSCSLAPGPVPPT